ncbi:LCP family protein [Streptomyces avidinii]|uniref:LCP family protein required for cell wall assembly n=1 Tax=Streptomyces avidinii TaxID=1895 RepID=A0ABS4KWT1_STRAV|nr:LCP family protein [Streptomyces avidinii]MBP2034486.1 LCP family protein required for cell wall assembly [Streptomyces avidinii]GGY86604.1 LytR family transcriptional regulator [Streptomyces avidinii]
MRRTAVALTLLTALSCGSFVGSQAVSAASAPAGAGGGGGGRGTNILVVGIDSRAGLSAAEKRRLHVGGKGCNCTDVMMLVHLSQNRRRASIVSIPRDSYVEYAGTTSPARSGKINGAYAIGGGPLTVATVEKATGLHIDHYLETGFTGFEQTVNNLGGATLCTDRPLKDENSGLDIGAGRHLADGNGALRYARARHVNLRPGDLGRVRRQQRVVNDLLARLTAEGSLDGPISTARTVRTLLKTVRTDARTGLDDLVRIGWALGRLRADRTEFATVPIRLFDHRVPGVGSTLVWDEARSAALWDALGADRPITGDTRIQPVAEHPAPTDPTRITVRVDDADVAAALRGNGFAVTDTSPTAPAVRPSGPPVVRYATGQEENAATVAAALPGSRLQVDPDLDAVVEVAVGSRPVQVDTITYDRNVADGAPVTADRLRCAEAPAAAGSAGAARPAGGTAGGTGPTGRR